MLYAGILVFGSILAIILKYFGSHAFVNFYAFQAGCRDSTQSGGSGDYYFPCAGDQAVYRISFGLVVFYLGMMPLGVVSKACHTGFWIVKIPVAIFCIIFPFFIPNEFFNVFYKIAYPFAGLYLVIQMLVIVGFAYDAHEFLVKKMDEQDEAEEEGSACCCCNMWKGIYLGGCLIVIIAIAAGIIFMFARFSCALPLTMISVLCVVTLLIIIVSILDKIGQGLLVGVLVAAYAVFLTWSALSSYPNPQSPTWKLVNGKNISEWVNIETCNPFLCDPTSANNTCNVGMMFLGIIFSAVSVGWTGWRVGLSSTRIFGDDDKDEDSDKDDDDSSAKKKKKKKSYGSRSKTSKDQEKLDKALTGEADAKDANLEADDDEDDDDESKKSKSCCGCGEQAGRLFFYVVMDLACWYLSMLLTNWNNSKQDQTHSEQIGVGYTSTGVQLAALGFMVFAYLWTLFAPKLCTCRDFS